MNQALIIGGSVFVATAAIWIYISYAGPSEAEYCPPVALQENFDMDRFS